MNIGTVQALWRYPVKSLRGEPCDELAFDARGVVGDRAYTVTDRNGKFGSGKTTRRFVRMDGLLDLSARYDDDMPVVTMPDGSMFRGQTPELDAALSRHVGNDVRLTKEADIPHFDAGAVHILTTASLRWLARQLPEADIDARRFRPNIVIGTEASEPLEMDWVGKRVAVGRVTLDIKEPTDRCVMTTMAQSELPNDSAILRPIAQQLDTYFGVYAGVKASGSVVVGDCVAVIE